MAGKYLSINSELFVHPPSANQSINKNQPKEDRAKKFGTLIKIQKKVKINALRVQESRSRKNTKAIFS